LQRLRRPPAQPQPAPRPRRAGRGVRRSPQPLLRGAAYALTEPVGRPLECAAGRMPERTNGTASKAVEGFGPPWVRIPLLPLPGPLGVHGRSLTFSIVPGNQRYLCCTASRLFAI